MPFHPTTEDRTTAVTALQSFEAIWTRTNGTLITESSCKLTTPRASKSKYVPCLPRLHILTLV